MKVSCTTLETSETVLSRVLADVLSSGGIDAEPFVMDSGEARRLSSVHEGVADLGVGLAPFVRWGYRDEGAYDGWRQTSLRALATLSTPTWFTVAARADLGLTTLEQLAARADGLDILCFAPDGHSAGWVYLTDALLAPFGVSLRDVRAAGRLVDVASYDGTQTVDVVVLPYGGVGLELAAWARTTSDTTLRTIDLADDAERVAKKHELEVRPLPRGGLLEPPSARGLFFPKMVVFATERMADEQAARIVELLLERRAELQAEGFGLDPTVALDPLVGIPYHRAAIGHYRAADLMPPGA